MDQHGASQRACDERIEDQFVDGYQVSFLVRWRGLRDCHNCVIQVWGLDFRAGLARLKR